MFLLTNRHVARPSVDGNSPLLSLKLKHFPAITPSVTKPTLILRRARRTNQSPRPTLSRKGRGNRPWSPRGSASHISCNVRHQSSPPPEGRGSRCEGRDDPRDRPHSITQFSGQAGGLSLP